MTADAAPTPESAHDIAVVGMACRVPGADTVERFWTNVRDGVESIRSVPDAAAGHARDRRWVAAAPVLDDPEGFDHRFFGLSPRDAELLDPQHRVFLECVWTAFEDAALVPRPDDGRPQTRVGVFAGAAMNTWFLQNEIGRLVADGDLRALVASDKDYLATRVSYQLDLRGPSLAVQTACSSSLVAVHLACQSLFGGECDIAAAGGVTVKFPHVTGYTAGTDGMLSPDGHCRAFDAAAAGTVFGSGAGVVLLRPLSDAIAAGDPIRAVIRGTAVNNDGAAKVDFHAPSPTRQSDVIVEALADADVHADTVSLIEAHGTGTALGDPIEVSALTDAFRTHTDRRGYCALGSVKTNVGHLDAAAGVVGLIKTVLCLEHRTLPPSLHFTRPNPRIDFDRSPFVVTTVGRPWSGVDVRRAGVSSFGIGGTNAHAILEEAPTVPAIGEGRRTELLVLSARTPTALGATRRRLEDHLRQHPDERISDVAHTLRAGRRTWERRAFVVARTPGEAAEALARGPSGDETSGGPPAVAFLFPGGGSRVAGAGRTLHDCEPAFRRHLDDTLRALARHTDGAAVRDLLLGPPGQESAPRRQLPALFAVERALAMTLLDWGVRPDAMAGHSSGELTAAHLAGVFSLADAAELVVARAELLEAVDGGMLSVALAEDDLRTRLGPALDLACVNGPRSCVVAGPLDELDELDERLAADGVHRHRLGFATAGHSRQVDPHLRGFGRRVRTLDRSVPQTPIVSTSLGRWLTADEAVDPAYWVDHVRRPVLFARAVDVLLAEPRRCLVEVGPGTVLTTLAARSARRRADHRLLSASPQPGRHDAEAVLLECLGQLWTAGVPSDWSAFDADRHPRRIALPTYPFERSEPDPPPATRTRPVGVVRRARGRWRRIRSRLSPPEHRRRRDVGSVVAGVWSEALGVGRLEADDDLFLLGATSLLVTEAIGRINAELGVDLSPLTVLESPTVGGLTRYVEDALGADTHLRGDAGREHR